MHAAGPAAEWENYMKNILFLIIDMQNGFSNQNTKGIDERILDFLEEIKGRAIVAGTRYVNNDEHGVLCV